MHMEFGRRSDGKLIVTKEQKDQILSEIASGQSTAEVARRYGLKIQNLIRWRRERIQATMEQPLIRSPEQQGVPLHEYQKLLEENRQLRRSLADMTLSRDVLKDAVDIASKKKWI